MFRVDQTKIVASLQSHGHSLGPADLTGYKDFLDFVRLLASTHLASLTVFLVSILWNLRAAELGVLRAWAVKVAVVVLW